MLSEAVAVVAVEMATQPTRAVAVAAATRELVLAAAVAAQEAVMRHIQREKEEMAAAVSLVDRRNIKMALFTPW